MYQKKKERKKPSKTQSAKKKKTYFSTLPRVKTFISFEVDLRDDSDSSHSK